LLLRLSIGWSQSAVHQIRTMQDQQQQCTAAIKLKSNGKTGRRAPSHACYAMARPPAQHCLPCLPLLTVQLAACIASSQPAHGPDQPVDPF